MEFPSEISVTTYKYKKGQGKPCMKDTLNNANRTYAETYLTAVIQKEFLFDLYMLSVFEVRDANITLRKKSNVMLLQGNKYANTNITTKADL
jgi:hypothetical protein